MTGVQTCALPICFPVTIPTDIFPWEMYREVRDWAEGSLTLEHMPGLASATWEGFILVQQDDGVPALICTLGTGE